MLEDCRLWGKRFPSMPIGVHPWLKIIGANSRHSRKNVSRRWLLYTLPTPRSLCFNKPMADAPKPGGEVIIFQTEDSQTRLLAGTVAVVEAVLPAILDRACKGEL